MNEPKSVFELDGARMDGLETFFDQVSKNVIPGAKWGRNLDGFNDVLRGGFGTPEGGFVLKWKNVARAKEALGYGETARWLARGASRVHPSNVAEWDRRRAAAAAGEGETLFDILVAIVRVHGAGGAEEEDGVELVLDD